MTQEHELQQLAVFSAVLERILPTMRNELPGNSSLPPGTRLQDVSPCGRPVCNGCDGPLDDGDIQNGNSPCDTCQLLSDLASEEAKEAYRVGRIVAVTQSGLEAGS